LTSFIYCVDKNLKNKFISKGYKLIKEESIQNQIAWVFEYNSKMQFDLKDTNKYFTSNTLRF
jgi:hypothetical protein